MANNFFFICFCLISFQVKAQYSYQEVILLDKNIKLNEKRADSILSLTTVKDTLYAQTAHSFSYFFYKKKEDYDLAIKYGLLEVKTFENLKIKNMLMLYIILENSTTIKKI